MRVTANAKMSLYRNNSGKQNHGDGEDGVVGIVRWVSHPAREFPGIPGNSSARAGNSREFVRGVTDTTQSLYERVYFNSYR